MSTLNLSGLMNKSFVMELKTNKPDRFYPTYQP